MTDLEYEAYATIKKILESEVKKDVVLSQGISDFSATRKKSKLKEEDDELADVNNEEKEEENLRDKPLDGSPSSLDLKKAQFVENIINKINDLRASHSFDDELVNKRMTTYFEEKLSREEKEILYLFLTSLSYIGNANSDIQAKNIYSPSDFNYAIHKTKPNSQEKRRAIHNRIKSKNSQKGLPISIVKYK